MKRWVVVLLAAVMLLGACGDKKVEGETADRFIQDAEQVVTLLNDGDTEGVHGMLDATMKEQLTADQLDEVVGIIKESGEYEQVDKSSVEKKDEYYTTVLVVKYSEQKRVFTITFNEQDEVAGLYIK
ncbi:hypothetical protein NCCP2716_22470 [Sporosarcina sp. NCCP-2716]|uniref:DUF3887 domain-containing protein n=1 Tax=Sporosarcina sp. NCCP-2716 TaxID=2943679 RepID=UPI00203FB9ED|nr:DUF3887 domain-containing protein [Sporosarcina sp. NCCP-2716]GKV69749.1 hypothetical protein NCCP2716_22470 [Sporosarcina sp. NCCP-2716]